MIRTVSRWSGPAALLASIALLGPACIGKRRPQPKDEAQAAQAAVAGSGKLLGPDDVDDKLSSLVTGERLQALYSAADPTKGSAAPLVTIVEYSDFQCPFCGKLATSIEEAVEGQSDVRLVFKQFPLPMHSDAEPGARAALAAHEQGKFWEMHDKLFANSRQMKPEDLEGYAKDIKLDLEKFKERAESDELKQRVSDDIAAGRGLNVSGTPAFFVNGRPFSGALPPDRIQSIVEEERKLAMALVEAGSTPAEVYARIMKAAAPTEAAPTPEPAKPPPAAPEAGAKDPLTALSSVPNHAVPVAEAHPTRGKADALVTVIEYSSLRCEDCRKTKAVIDEVAKNHPEVRFAFANLPGNDVLAQRSAKAGLAANAQGKFWELREALMVEDYDARKLLEVITNLGLDSDKFKADLASEAVQERVALDGRIADVFRGEAEAPIVFVNGRALVGVPTVEAIESLIAEETKKAEAAAAQIKPAQGEDLYTAMVKTWRSWSDVEKAMAAQAPAEPPAQ